MRLLGKGELTAEVAMSVAGASKSAVEAVEKAGGSVTLTGAGQTAEAAARMRLAAAGAGGLSQAWISAPPRPEGRRRRVMEGRMASAAEQMAANLSWSTFGKAKDLQSRILFALGLLIVYRIGTYIPVPGVDAARLQQFFEQQSEGLGGMLNMFTGGAVGRMAIFSLGIMPYISASIIVQLLDLDGAEPAALKKEGEAGRKKINQYTRYGTVFLATFQAYGLAVGLEAENMAHDPGWFFRLGVIITLVGGTMFLMWLGEQITARGIGNGISLIIFTGIVAQMPAALAQFFTQGRTGALSPAVIVGVMVMAVAVVAFVVFMERALRKIHIQYPKRQVGMKIYGGESSNLPIKVNPAGVIPAIFASSLLLLPATITTFSGQSDGRRSGI